MTVQRGGPTFTSDQARRHLDQRGAGTGGMGLGIGRPDWAGFTPPHQTVIGHDFDERRVERIHLGLGHGVRPVLDRQIVGVDVNLGNTHDQAVCSPMLDNESLGRNSLPQPSPTTPCSTQASICAWL